MFVPHDAEWLSIMAELFCSCAILAAVAALRLMPRASRVGCI